MRKKTFLLIFSLLFLIIGSSKVSFAVPAAPVIYELIQPDGTVVEARQWGDEWSHGWETTDGYSIIFDKKAENWKYALDNNGRLAASKRLVGRDNPPPNIPLHLRPAVRGRSETLQQQTAQSSDMPQEVVPPAGIANVPVILINFSNTNATYTPADFNSLLFGTGNKSMKDFYEEVSYGAFSVSAGPSGVAGWYTASNTHNYYGRNFFGSDRWPGTLVREAVAAADATFDFAPYDQDGDCYVDVIEIVHQGTGEEAGGPPTDIWSHRWNLNSAFFFGRSDGGEYITNDTAACGNIKVDDYVMQPEILFGGLQTMGVFAHEYGHALGLPDLYDTDNSSEGIGNWGLMAGGSWNSVTTPGDTPAHMSAWSKYFLGWISPVQVTGVLLNQPIQQAATSADVYQFLPGSPSGGGEYFLIENRNQTGFDAGLPGSGLAIWHIDESKSNNTQECYPPNDCTSTHYWVSLEQADANWDLEKNINRGNATDLWYLGNATTFDAASTPDSNLYDGSSSDVSVTYISASGSTMTTSLIITCPNLPVRNIDTLAEYSSLQVAYTAAGDSETIQSQAVVFIENLNINQSKSVTLEGGYDCDYAVITGKTTLNGTLMTDNGTLTIGNFILE